MEASSPLAAMHRPAAPFGKRDLFTSVRVRLSPGKPRPISGLGSGLGSGFGGGLFRLSHDEAFGPVHGSSPAGSLAADLCQNFTIGDDASPRFPTPRRALFTHGGERAKAPPLPVSSSPLASLDDCMDMTPVPRKPAAATAVFLARAASPLSSPSPASPSPTSDDMMLESPCPGPPAALEPSRPLSSGIEKLPRRASLTRAKGYSFAGPSARLHAADNQLPFFRFGESRQPALAPVVPAAAPSLSRNASSLSIAECFQESPPQPLASEGRPQSAQGSPCPTGSTSTTTTTAATTGHAALARPPRPAFVSLASAPSAAASARAGSPVTGHHGHNGHVRRPSSSFVRPRRQYRRSLSMFENPGDMMKPKRGDDPAVSHLAARLPPPPTTCAMDTDDVPPTMAAAANPAYHLAAPCEPALPHFFPAGQDDSIPRIDRATLLRVLDGQYNDAFEHKLIIDCRFEYEYAGGHISEAVNYNDKSLLADHLFAAPPPGRTLIVLHCEYSAHRAPLMARHIRAQDRARNAEHYPRLTYPELYILDGGYSAFFGEHPCRCYPQAYVEMDDAAHAFACEREMGRLKHSRKGLHRAQTFAFGQAEKGSSQNGHVGGSSTSGGSSGSSSSNSNNSNNSSSSRGSFNPFFDAASPPTPSLREASSPSMMMGASPILGCDRGHARRMASY